MRKIFLLLLSAWVLMTSFGCIGYYDHDRGEHRGYGDYDKDRYEHRDHDRDKDRDDRRDHDGRDYDRYDKGGAY